MNFKLKLDRRQFAYLGIGIILVSLYFSLITTPNAETLAGLYAEVELKSKQLKELQDLKEKLSECDKLTANLTDSPMSIESRVEKVGRDLNLQPQIRKVSDSSPTEPNKVEVRLGSLYLREMVEFLRRIEAFPVTVQIVRLQIDKQANVAGVALILSDLNL